jgi:hypothetical protein
VKRSREKHFDEGFMWTWRRRREKTRNLTALLLLKPDGG